MLGACCPWTFDAAFILDTLACVCLASLTARSGSTPFARLSIRVALVAAPLLLLLVLPPTEWGYAGLWAAAFLAFSSILAALAAGMHGAARPRSPFTRISGALPLLGAALFPYVHALLMRLSALAPAAPVLAADLLLVLAAVLALHGAAAAPWRRTAAVLALAASGLLARLPLPAAASGIPAAMPPGAAAAGIALDMMALIALFLLLRHLLDREIRRRGSGLADLRAANEDLSLRLRVLLDEHQRLQEHHAQQCECLMDCAGAGFVDWDLPSGTVRMGGRWATMLGYDERSPVDQFADPWLRLCHDDDKRDAQRLLAELVGGLRKEVLCDVRMRAAWEGWRWVRIHARPVEWSADGMPRRILATQTDVDVLRNVEQVLRSERRLFMSGPVIILAFEAEPPHRLREFSPNLHDALSMPEGPSAAGLTLGKLFDAETCGWIRELGQRPGGRAGSSAQRHVRLARGDGTRPWYLLHLATGGAANDDLVHAYLVDIDLLKETERRAARRDQALQDVAREMNQTRHFMRTLQQTTALLHLCENEDQGWQIVSDNGLRLFPAWSGALTFTDDDGLTGVRAAWGEAFIQAGSATPGKCWAERRGRLHQCAPDASGPLSLMCSHFVRCGLNRRVRHAVCAPLPISEDRSGVLHLVSFEAMNEWELRRAGWAAEALADALKMSLANLRLRTSLRQQAVSDAMTGLYNRRYFDEMMRRELNRAQRTGESLVLAIIDIDDFKHFNDSFGHEAGDRVLRVVADEIRRFVRSYDIACRIGGEELAIIMPRVLVDEAGTRLEELRHQIGLLDVAHAGIRLPPISVSMGLAAMDADRPDDLQHRADMALYAAKRTGKNRIRCWEAALDPLAGNRKPPDRATDGGHAADE